MNRFLHSRYFVALAALLAAFAAFAFSICSGDVPYAFDSALVRGWNCNLLSGTPWGTMLGIAACVGIASLLVYANKQFNLLRSLTMFQGSAFMLMMAAVPWLMTGLNSAVLLALVMLAVLIVLFASYGRPYDSQRSVFLTFFAMSSACGLDYSFALFLPVMWLVVAQMRIFNLRSVIASILGIVSPWIILFAFGIVSPHDIVAPNWSDFIGGAWINADRAVIVTCVYSAALGLAAWLRNLLKIISYNAQSRSMLSAVSVIMLVGILAVAFDLGEGVRYLPLLSMCVALQLGHLFGVMDTWRKSWIAIILLMLPYVLISAYSVAKAYYT